MDEVRLRGRATIKSTLIYCYDYDESWQGPCGDNDDDGHLSCAFQLATTVIYDAQIFTEYIASDAMNRMMMMITMMMMVMIVMTTYNIHGSKISSYSLDLLKITMRGSTLYVKFLLLHKELYRCTPYR